MENRFRWSEAYLDWTVDDWRRVIFTDEASFNCGGVTGNTWVTRSATEEFHKDYLKPKFRKFSLLHKYGGIMYNGRTPRVIWDKKNWGNFSARTYAEHILIPVLSPYYHQQQAELDTELYIVQDNAPCHKANATLKLFEDSDNQVHTLPLEFQRPGLVAFPPTHQTSTQ